jgi:hypothetical protein
MDLEEYSHSRNDVYLTAGTENNHEHPSGYMVPHPSGYMVSHSSGYVVSQPSLNYPPSE